MLLWLLLLLLMLDGFERSWLRDWICTGSHEERPEKVGDDGVQVYTVFLKMGRV